MSAPSIFDQVAKILRDTTGATRDQIRRDTVLKELRLDSLDQVELVMELEDVFGIDVLDREAESLRTVADIEALVRAKLGLGENADLAEAFGGGPAS